MFVQSAHFVEEHKKSPSAEISIYGQERVAETVKLNKMNLAVHGLGGDIRQGNTYYEDLHTSPGKFDFVLANPPFNVDRVDKDRLKDDPRFPLGLPKVDNANYLWIQIFYSALSKNGRAGFVMANVSADARASELEIRKKLIQARAVDVMVAIGPNMFYTVVLPCSLWFLDKGKASLPPSPQPSPKQAPSPLPSPSGRGKQGEGHSFRTRDTVLFLDARHIFRQIDRAHRDFTPEQIEFIANIVRLYRGEKPENQHGSAKMMAEEFPEKKYADVSGLCKVATVKEIEAQGWSLNPGRYVGVAEGEEEDFDFKERLGELNEELETLNAEAKELEERISENIEKLLS
jgi:type I restriction enzyme M protein